MKLIRPDGEVMDLFPEQIRSAQRVEPFGSIKEDSLFVPVQNIDEDGKIIWEVTRFACNSHNILALSNIDIEVGPPVSLMKGILGSLKNG